MLSPLNLPALAIHGASAMLAGDGAARPVEAREARAVIESGEVLVCHAQFVASRLNARLNRPVCDVLELLAFARPGTPCLPSPAGLARALSLPVPASPAESAAILPVAARMLLNGLATVSKEARQEAAKTAAAMTKAGWRWGPSVLDVLGAPEKIGSRLAGFDAWKGLPKWEDDAPQGMGPQTPLTAEDVLDRLQALVRSHGTERRQQKEFAAAAIPAFSPRLRENAPNIALVEAGTGTGKTLGYLAPVSVYAERNGPGLWISTYTRNLQRQIFQEIGKLYPDPKRREEMAVIRKGRENYLCLLNYEEAASRVSLMPGQRAIILGLIARWLSATKDGDLSAAEFPAFLAGFVPLRELTDRRGECIYAACPHYRVCFIEHGLRRARRTPIVVANHALVLAQAARDGSSTEEDGDVAPERPIRYVFDEGHHLFDAADSAFSLSLSGSEMAELRRWLRGPEGQRTRARGLSERLREMIADDSEAQAALDEALQASSALAGEGWLSRVNGGTPRGAGEQFLALALAHVRARSPIPDSPYGIEAETHPLPEELGQAAHALHRSLYRLSDPLTRLASALRARLNAKAAELDENTRQRLDAAARGLERRARLLLPAWRSMLASLEAGEEEKTEFADWFAVERDEGRDAGIGLYRHWIDPTIPFAETVLKPCHGALIASATLRDGGGASADWRSAEVRVGAHHMPEPPSRVLIGSPFDFSRQSRIIVVRDVARRDIGQLASAYRELFLASGGGALGLFTAVKTLRAVHARIHAPLSDMGLTLYAQHVDALDTGTLVDLFRDEENASLLGTDALRDGVDVAGRSLRLCVFDKVPWPKPSLLHRARRERFGKDYDDMIARLRLKQAFGRLVRTESDKGVFVLLDAACPSRLLAALPENAPVLRCSLKDAIAEVVTFLGDGRKEF